MGKQEFEQGDSNVVVRNQVVYGALPQDVIDRMGDTTLNLLTNEQTVIPAINELKSNLTDKFYVITGTLASSSGWSTDIPYPTGFNINNTIIISFLIDIDSNNTWRTGEGLSQNANARIFGEINENSIRAYNSESSFFSRPYKIAIMRTDI